MRATLRQLQDALDRAQTKLAASQKQYKEDFDKKVCLRPVVGAGDFVNVDRQPGLLKSVERRSRAQGTTGMDELSVKLLPKTEGLFRVRPATNTTVFNEQDGVENRMSIASVTKMPRRPGATVISATLTESDARVAMPSAEYDIDRIVGHRTTCGEIDYKARWYRYTASADTPSPPMGSCNRASTDTGFPANDGQRRTRSVTVSNAWPRSPPDYTRERLGKLQALPSTGFFYYNVLRSPAFN